MAGGIGTIALTLSPAAPDVHLTGTIDAYGAAGIYGGATFYAAVFGPADGGFTVHNSGVVESAGTSATDAGIVLGAPGTVLNDGGLRAGAGIAVFGGPGGFVRDKCEIEASLGIGVYLQGAGTVDNTGIVTAQVDGIVLAGGGYAMNAGTVEGGAGILLGGGPGGYVYNTGLVKSAKRDGISLSAAGYVYNTGHIRSARLGIDMAGGGLAYNSGIILGTRDGIYSAGGAVYNYAKGHIVGAPYGVFLGGAGYVYNAGSILGEGDKAATVGAAVGLAGGGYVYNAAGGTLNGLSGVVARGGALTLVNEGFIYGAGSNYATAAAGVYAALGGTVVNGGTIQGDQNYYPGAGGILIAGAAGTVTNAGLMSGYFGAGAIVLRDGGSVNNSGKIFDFGGAGLGILLQGGGAVQNAGYVSAIYAGGGATVTNTGTVIAVTLAGGLVTNENDMDYATLRALGTLINAGTMGSGVALQAGGTVVNTGGIYGLSDGILMAGGGTIFQAGTVRSRGEAVYFKAGYDNRLVLSPGASFVGSVAGGGGVLELAAGLKVGTLDLGTSISGFASLTIDAGAAWAFATGSTLAAGLPVENDGTMLAVGGAGVTIAGELSGAGTVVSGGGLTLDGAVAAGQNVALSGQGETLYLGDAAGFAGKIESFTTGETIDLTGVAANLVTGISFSGGVLTVKEAFSSYEITFSNPGSFAHEKFVSFRDHGETGITLSPRKKMAFLAPAARAAAAVTGNVPPASYGTSAPPAGPPAGPQSISATGWLDSALRQTIAGLAPVVTLQG